MTCEMGEESGVDGACEMREESRVDGLTHAMTVLTGPAKSLPDFTTYLL